jgi:hypothetical protein
LVKRRRQPFSITTNFSDVCIAFINKGLPIPLLIALIIGCAIFRIPQDQVASFTLKAINNLTAKLLDLILFFLWIITLIICYFKSKIMQKEIDRISTERNRLQNDSGSHIESSEE